jgi:hypothetical protein
VPYPEHGALLTHSGWGLYVSRCMLWGGQAHTELADKERMWEAEQRAMQSRIIELEDAVLQSQVR